ncbi:uncharacterized protein TrAFT101_002158 [Trichoderma asperellum]|uniref:uncharacterized protein n=1 Tax=Trichoderma asperellum TaxID=101201 RepID=UPI00332B3596|nr:hypothetical protein TrAFT101_002158 [Trichoderma asperellum]
MIPPVSTKHETAEEDNSKTLIPICVSDWRWQTGIILDAVDTQPAPRLVNPDPGAEPSPNWQIGLNAWMWLFNGGVVQNTTSTARDWFCARSARPDLLKNRLLDLVQLLYIARVDFSPPWMGHGKYTRLPTVGSLCQR